ncbi:MAG: hypothetical protein HN350_22230, partial [Phycisphaerales bacterium]|nr:hypothetical protein [Phycisphaerales bacterium]
TNHSDNQPAPGGKPRRRKRYPGSHPRRFEQRYKELAGDAETVQHIRGRRRTPAGTHVPVMPDEVIEALAPRPGQIVADCTLGYQPVEKLSFAVMNNCGFGGVVL